MTERPAVIVTGVSAHADPWHGLPATSAALADLLAERMPVRRLDTDDVSRGATLTDAALVVLNVSGDLAIDAVAASAVLEPVLDAVAGGIPLLAVHSSSLAFRDDSRWAALLGGRWVPGVTVHPQIGWSLVQPTTSLAPFTVYDERYSKLEVADGSTVRAIHTDDGIAHPLAWSRPGENGHGGVAYSALGHGAEAYLADGMRRLIHALIDELLVSETWRSAASDRSAAGSLFEDALTATALDYELIALAPRGAELRMTGFADQLDTGRLLASGYLLLERLADGGAVLHSHGREAARVLPDERGLHVDLPGGEVCGRVLRSDEAGIAMVAEVGEWHSEGVGSATLLGDDWRVVAVHGPATVKLDNRVRLLDDLRAVFRTREEQHG